MTVLYYSYFGSLGIRSVWTVVNRKIEGCAREYAQCYEATQRRFAGREGCEGARSLYGYLYCTKYREEHIVVQQLRGIQ